MSRLTGNDAKGLMEAYNAVYAPQELTEEQVWEEVENWVNSLVEEGYDLSEYTWEEMYESYIEEAGMDVSTAIQKANSKPSSVFTKPVQKAPPLGQPGSGFQNTRPVLGMPTPALTLPPNRVGPGLVGGKVGPKIVGPKIVGPGRVDSGSAPTRTATPPAKPTGGNASVSPTKPAASAQTGDKAKDTATWAKANPKLAAAAAEKARIRGTQQTDNPLMKSMRSRLPMNSPSVQAPAVAGLGKGNQSLSQNPNAFKAAPPKPVATSTAPEVKATNTIAATPKPTPVTPSKPTPRQARLNMEEYDAYDLVLEYLLSQGHADTLEEAHYVMLEMDAEMIGDIVEQYLDETRNITDRPLGIMHQFARGVRTRKGEKTELMGSDREGNPTGKYLRLKHEKKAAQREKDADEQRRRNSGAMSRGTWDKN